MIFKITRTSLSSKEQPCPEAIQTTFIEHDHRTCSLGEAIKRKLFKSPYAQWSNLREEHGRAVADYNLKGWMIEFITLDQLITFVNKYDDIIIKKPQNTFFQGQAIGEMEIYDDYRE